MKTHREHSHTTGVLPKAPPETLQTSNMNEGISPNAPPRSLRGCLSPDSFIMCWIGRVWGQERGGKGEGLRGGHGGAGHGATPPQQGGTSHQPGSEARKSGAAGTGSTRSYRPGLHCRHGEQGRVGSRGPGVLSHCWAGTEQN